LEELKDVSINMEILVKRIDELESEASELKNKNENLEKDI
jgi:hypothetical protein